MAIDFVDGNPAAPTGRENIEFQADPAASPRPEISANIPNIAGVNAQTGTSYTVQESDNGKLVTFSNASAVAVTIPHATTLSAKFHCAFTNLGAGTVTLTPTTSTIDGGASLALTQYQGAALFSDATNYFTTRGFGSSSPLSAKGDIYTRSGSADARQAVGVTDGMVPVVDASKSNGWEWKTISGSSAVTGVNVTPDSHPTSPNVADDEFEVGSSIDTAGTRATSATAWSWINQGSATAVVGSGYLTLTAPSSASHNFRIVQQPVSGSAWRFRAKIRTFFTPDGTSVAEVGMIVSASGGKFITFLTLIPGNIANVQMFLARWTNPTTQAAGTTSGTIISCAIQEAVPWIYLDIELAAATLTLKYSWDGVTFKTFTTETLAAHIITADNIGLMANVEGGTSVTTNVCDWFRRIS